MSNKRPARVEVDLNESSLGHQLSRERMGSGTEESRRQNEVWKRQMKMETLPNILLDQSCSVSLLLDRKVYIK